MRNFFRKNSTHQRKTRAFNANMNTLANRDGLILNFHTQNLAIDAHDGDLLDALG